MLPTVFHVSILYSVICIIQVPSSQDRFVFGSGQPSGAPDLIVTSSNSGLQGQEGLDRTALDIQVFARGGAEPAQQQNVSAFAAEEEEINIDESEEDGINISTLSNNVRRRQSNLSNVKLQETACKV